MDTQINVAKLSNHFKLWQYSHKTNNAFWEPKWKASINQQLKHLPSGSGLDVGIKFDWQNSTPECLRFKFPFHHMDKNGKYEGWTHHELLIQPSFGRGFNLNITGEDRNETLNYLTGLFYSTFHYQPNYRDKNGTITEQLLALYDRLKNAITKLTQHQVPLKKLRAKS